VFARFEAANEHAGNVFARFEAANEHTGSVFARFEAANEHTGSVFIRFEAANEHTGSVFARFEVAYGSAASVLGRIGGSHDPDEPWPSDGVVVFLSGTTQQSPLGGREEGMITSSSPSHLDHELLEGEQALRRLRPELEALVARFKPRGLNVPYAVSVVLGAQPVIVHMLPLMARYTPLASVSRIEHLRGYALATAFVHHRCQPRAPLEDLGYPALVYDAYSLRKRLTSAAVHLSDLGLLDADRVMKIREGRGHIGAGDGLLALATLFEEHWSKVMDSTPIARQELRRAAEIGAKLLASVSERRERRRRRVDDHRHDDLRRRAIQMMYEVYEEARAVAAYIGWYEPALHPLPSLFRQLSRARAVTHGELVVEGVEVIENDGKREDHLVAAE
jgi:hypothetical protein